MVHLDQRTKRWCFRTSVRTSCGRYYRIYGTPGVPGAYHDLPQSKTGALEAERRAISKAMNASTINAAALKKAVAAFVSAESKRGVSSRTINNTLEVLSRLNTFVTGEKTKVYLDPDGPRAGVRALERIDIDRLLAACNDERWRAVILLASEAGLRAGEICDLEWTDLGNEQLTLRAPKHDKPRNVPLSSRVAEALAVLPRISRWIVSTLDGNKMDHGPLTRVLGEIFRRAGIVRASGLLHCLRLTFKETIRG